MISILLIDFELVSIILPMGLKLKYHPQQIEPFFLLSIFYHIKNKTQEFLY